MVRMLPLLIAVALAIGYGIFEGLWTNRWTRLAELELAAARLKEVPLTVGEWDGQAQELNARQIEIGEIAGYIMRHYVHRRIGKSLTVLLLCGRPGPIALHTPEYCFGGAGFSEVSAAVKYAVQGEAENARGLTLSRPAEFWTAKFQKLDVAEPEQVRVFWSWTTTGEWTAADHPRLKFARSPILYKLYLTQQLSSSGKSFEDNPGSDFLPLFLPEVETSLVIIP